MSLDELINKLSKLAEQRLDDLYELALEASEDYPNIQAELKEAHRRLKLAIERELMDEYQTKLAFRVTIKNLVKRHKKLQEELSESEE